MAYITVANKTPETRRRHAAMPSIGILGTMVLTSFIAAGCNSNTPSALEKRQPEVRLKETPESSFYKLYGQHSPKDEQQLVETMLQEEGAQKAYILLKEGKIKGAQAQALLAQRIMDFGTYKEIESVALNCTIIDPKTRRNLILTVIQFGQPDVILELLDTGKITQNWPKEDHQGDIVIEMSIEINGQEIKMYGSPHQIVEIMALVDLVVNWDAIKASMAYMDPNWTVSNAKEIIAAKIIGDATEEVARIILNCDDISPELRNVLQQAIDARQKEKKQQEQEQERKQLEQIRRNGT